MNLNHLRFARTVAETRSFSAAAERCCVTQPTLSNAVAQLEDSLGGRLFKRTTRSVSPTRFGEAMLPLIEAVLEAEAELAASAAAYHNPEQKLVRIGMSPLIDTALLGRVLAPFRERHPEAEIFLKQCFLDDLGERLDKGTVDLALVPRGLVRGGREPFGLYAEDLYFLPREAGVAPEAGGNAASLGDIAGEPIILTSGCGLSDVIKTLFADNGYDCRVYPGQALSYAVVEEWAGLGIAAGILPRSKLSPDNQAARPIVLDDGMTAGVAYEAVWSAETADMDHVAGFRDHLRTVAPSLAGGAAS